MREKFVVFETDFISLLTKVNETNHSIVLAALELLITKQKTVLSKSQVLTILYKINHEFEMNQLQEKVFLEMEQKIIENISFS